MSIGRVRAVFGVKMTKVSAVIGRAEAMANGMGADTVTYASPNPTLPAFKILITNVITAEAAVKSRTAGAVATRDVQLHLLIGGMENERVYVQGLSDATPARAVQLIENAGLVVAKSPTHSKLMLELRNGPQPGSIACSANVGLLVGAGATHPRAARFYGWQYTADGGKTFVTAASTATSKTLLTGLPPVTLVGVRVNITTRGVTSEWTDVATIVVH